ncbi:MAG: glutathione-disulfide reductase [Myxococcales bacterium]|nr:glutathione-disulfide reductase [Myxococcales bacterium]
MPGYDYDLIVIGGGSGGVRAARMAASYGARVVLVEEKEMGGTCVNVGCVPKKLFAFGSHYSDDLRDMAAYGWQLPGEARFDWATLKRNKDKEIARLNGIYLQILDRADVEVATGRGTVTGPHEVTVGTRRLSGQHILVATGGRPWRPEPAQMPGVEHTWVSDHIFEMEELPERMLVVGGGYIAVEMASIFHGFGVNVDLAYRGEMLLRGFDDDVRHELSNELRKRGLHVHFRCAPQRVTREADGRLRVHMDDSEVVVTDAVLMATGRVPNTFGLGLQDVGVQLSDRGAVLVNDRYQTTVPSIYAVGDVIDRMQLTPVALAEGMLVARNLFLGEDNELDYAYTPTAVFTHPSVGTVGYTEAEARKHFGAVRLFKSHFRPMRHTLTGHNERTFMKLIVDAETDRVVGLHMVGPDAAEITQGFAVAMRCGATKAQFDATIGIHPSAAEELVTMRTEWTPPTDGEVA